MKSLNKSLIVLCFLCTSNLLFAQTLNPECDRIMADGQAAENKQHFKEAITKYNAVVLCDPSRKTEIDKRILAVFAKIEVQRDEAIRAKNALNTAKKQVELERDLARKAEQDAVHQTGIANAAYRTNFNSALAFQMIRKDPTLALQIAAYNFEKSPGDLLNAASYYQIIGDTSLVFYEQNYQFESAPLCLAASPDGQWIAAGLSDGQIMLRRVRQPDDNPVMIKASAKEIRSLSFSPDGKFLLSGGADWIPRLWQISQPAEPYRVYAVCEAAVMTVAFAPDGRYFAVGIEDNKSEQPRLLTVWDVDRTDAPVLKYAGYSSTVTTVGFTHDGKYVFAGGFDNSLRLWLRDKTDAPVKSMFGHQSDVWLANVSPNDRKIVTAGGDGTIRVWNTEKPDSNKLVYQVASNEVHMKSALFVHEDHNVLTAGRNSEIKLWDLDKQCALVRSFVGHRGEINALCVVPGERKFYSAADKSVKCWSLDARPGRDVAFPSGSAATLACFMTSDSTVITTGTDGYIKIATRSDKGYQVDSCMAHAEGIMAASVFRQGKKMATSGYGNGLKIWDLNGACRQIAQVESVHGPLNCLGFSADGRYLAAAGFDSTVYVWSCDDWRKPLWICKGHLGRILCLQFSPDGHYLASGSEDNTAIVWDLSQTPVKPFCVLAGHSLNITAIAFSPANDFLGTTSSDRSIRIWDLKSADHSALTFQTNSLLNTIAFSPKGDGFVTGSDDGYLRFWSTRGLKESYWINGFGESEIPSVAYSPSGNFVSVAHMDGLLEVWPTPSRFVSNHVAPASFKELLSAGFLIDFDSLVANNSDPSILAQAAQHFYQSGDYVKSKKIWEKIIQKDPSGANYMGLYQAELKLGKDITPKILELNNKGIIDYFAHYFSSAGNWNNAKTYYDKWNALDGDEKILAERYMVYLHGNFRPDTLLLHFNKDGKSINKLLYYISGANRTQNTDDRIRCNKDALKLYTQLKTLDSTLYDPWQEALFRYQISLFHIYRQEYQAAYDADKSSIECFAKFCHNVALFPRILLSLEKYDELDGFIAEWKDKPYDPGNRMPKFRDGFLQDFMDMQGEGGFNEMQRKKILETTALLEGNQ